MPSIAGIFSLNGEMLEGCGQQVDKMLGQMWHRGPDNVFVRTLPDRRGALGANEVNLVPERTCSTSFSRPPFIVFDGELFNERAPGQHDVEL
ncbi:MAG TPA: hypothetical protein ENN57_00835, partial [Chloroflexi bacterium]|nr:hypothetical protein [Chloroflexota bacterium]